ncbi:hypothetical protein KIN20_033982 [Parelaphostrongylus tenuis]|uniref:Uncharacterized protein n=1 Tax=Parelaphostrongylus tenuis TaxID=148309 RepID=A0AAD5R9L8_PARTN|nr:hypothetical protein KIN20_033982 [Parelaphostrongylus tenuis]
MPSCSFFEAFPVEHCDSPDRLDDQVITENGETNTLDKNGNQESDVHVEAALPSCPFVTALPVKQCDSLDRLEEDEVRWCSKRFRDVIRNFGNHLVRDVFKKFVAIEPTDCVYCNKKLRNFALLKHSLREMHIHNVYQQGKTFSTKDRDLLFEILDFIERTAKDQVITQNSKTNPSDVRGNQEADVHVTAALPSCPFLEALFIEDRHSLKRLDESDVAKCSKRLRNVIENFGGKLVETQLKKFVTIERAECVHCSKKLQGIAVLTHSLSSKHKKNVYENGKTFSTNDRDLLFGILDFIEQTGKGQLITQSGVTNSFEEHENQEANVRVTAALTDCPFLEPFSLEHWSIPEILDGSDVAKCSKRFHKVIQNFGAKLVKVQFKKFFDVEQTRCDLCKKSLRGFDLFSHCLSKRHIRKVYTQGKTFSTKDRDLLFKLLDFIERNAREASVRMKTTLELSTNGTPIS